MASMHIRAAPNAPLNGYSTPGIGPPARCFGGARIAAVEDDHARMAAAFRANPVTKPTRRSTRRILHLFISNAISCNQSSILKAKGQFGRISRRPDHVSRARYQPLPPRSGGIALTLVDSLPPAILGRDLLGTDCADRPASALCRTSPRCQNDIRPTVTPSLMCSVSRPSSKCRNHSPRCRCR